MVDRCEDYYFYISSCFTVNDMQIFRVSLLITFLFLSNFLISQVCDGFLTFNNQEALDQFVAENPDCTEIGGDLYLQFGVNTEGTPITNTDALQNIMFIAGRLTLEDNPMTSSYPVSLSGLSGLTYVHDLYIYSFANLTSIEGLNNLLTIESDLFFGMQGEDVSLAPLDNVSTVSNVTFGGGPTASFENVLPSVTNIYGVLQIGFESPILESVTGFENLSYCNSLQIGFSGANTIAIETMDAFHNLQECNYLVLYCNTTTLFSGFDNLLTCSTMEIWSTDEANPISFDSLYAIENLSIIGDFTNGISFPTLQDVYELTVEGSGPISLTEVPGITNIFIQNCGHNAELELQLNESLITDQLSVQFNAFENLSFFPQNGTILSYLTIAYNENLNFCGHPAVCEFVPLNPESSFIELNSSGCNDTVEALASCGESLISGTVYYDADCNGVFGGNDIPQSYQFIEDPEGNILSVTNADGIYFIPASGISIMTIVPDTIVGLLPATPISIDLSETQGTVSNQDFPLCHDLSQYNVSVHLFAQEQLRPGFNSTLAVQVNNQTWSPVSGYVTVDLSLTAGLTIIDAFSGTIQGMVVTFPVVFLDSFSDQVFFYNVYVDANVPLGTMQTVNASIVLDGGTDNYTLDDSETITLEVIGSYDPNDITVNKPAIEYNQYDVGNGEWLEYLIRFQNTGTADAIFIHVLNEIAEELDLASFELLQTSHSMSMSISNREIDFFFEDINLPDSTSNLEGSQGFIFYRIRSISNLSVEDLISNQVAIYFDFNDPIFTNTALTEFYLDCPSDPVVVGLTTLCSEGTFTLDAIGEYENYTWNLDGEIFSSDDSFSFTSTVVSELEGMLIATSGLCNAIVPFTLTTYGIPPTPEITQIGNTLTANGTGVFSWYLDGVLLEDSDNTVEATESGTYSVQVSINDCNSEFAEIYHTYIGIESFTTSNWLIYPNPAVQAIHVVSDESFTHPFIEIYNSVGNLVFSARYIPAQFVIDCRQWSAGYYTVRHGDFDLGKYYSEILVVQ